MPIETFNYLDSLVPSNPTVGDAIAGGDDHIRGIKLTIKNTFPNLTGAVNATQAQLNAAAAWADAGVNKLADAGVFFKTNSTDGFKNPLAGDIDLYLQNNKAAEFSRAGGVNFLKWHGPATFDAEIKGPGITPIGGTLVWHDDTLPGDGLWAWANGQIITNANVVCPVLLARWGNRYGGNGITTMGLPNLQEVVLVGKSGMGGATAPGLLASISAGVKDVLNSVFGADTVTLNATQIPGHDHAVYLKDPGHTHTGDFNSKNDYAQAGPGPSASLPRSLNGSINSATTGITIGSVNGTANDNKTASTGGELPRGMLK